MADKFNLDPKAIVEKVFDIDFKGYNAEQVDKFLDLVIKDYQMYQKLLDDAEAKLQELENINASLRLKVVEMEGRQRAQQDASPILNASGTANVDILKRISRLEEQVFKNNNH